LKAEGGDGGELLNIYTFIRN